MNIKIEDGSVHSPLGFKAAGIHCGIKKHNKDLALIYSEVPCEAAGVFTKSVVKGEPLLVTMENIKDGKAQAIIVNSGNANTCTGDQGKETAYLMAKYTGETLDITPSNVLVGSTGVIGVPLDINPIKNSLPALVDLLDKGNALDACEAILTTDILSKNISVKIELDNKIITIGAMAKGSGMIHPNMATMLSFITTDLAISHDLLKKALKQTVDNSYNRISVDGSTSTNDMVLILANGLAGNKLITEEDENYAKFVEALQYLNVYLAKLIAKDGEGATKLIECIINNAPSQEAAEICSKSIIADNLVKTAMFGNDANWGRILGAIGKTALPIDVSMIDVSFKSEKGTVLVCQNSAYVKFDEDKAFDILNSPEVTVNVDFKSGVYSAKAWGCDLTYEYVKINGEYRS